MLESLIEYDIRLLLYLNDLRSDFWDQWMPYITNQWYWTPVFFIGLWVIYKQKGWHGVWVIIGVALVILLADQISSSLFKPLTGRLRPCHHPELKTLIHAVDGCGGKYGFFSGHASNSFGVAVFLCYVFTRKYRWYNVALFIWAGIFSYSRIYLGKHYPSDILFGILAGLLIGWGVSRLYALASKKIDLIKS